MRKAYLSQEKAYLLSFTGRHSQETYPLLSPLLNPSRKEEWSKADARRFRDWFLTELPIGAARVSAFLRLDTTLSPEEQLEDAGHKLLRLLPQPAFSGPSERETGTLKGHRISYDAGPLLTEVGSSLAIDLGFLMATWFQAEMPFVRWEIVTRPRSDVSFNLPVLRGHKAGDFDPMLISLATAHGVLSGRRPPSAFRDVYEYWKSEASTPGGRPAKQ